MAKRHGGGRGADRAGFQGVSPDGRITTLGRGGSDTSAVALAAALKADRCDIYTDVDGVYTTDPRIVEKARKLDQVTYEEMLEMASLGAKVLQTRSVELAMNHHVRVQVLSSFDAALGSDLPGTMVVDEEEIMEGLEKSVVSGIAYAGRGQDHPDPRARPAGRRRGDLRPAGRRQHQRRHDRAERLARRQHDRHELHRPQRRPRRAPSSVLEQAKAELKFAEVQSDTNVAKVSVIGVGMRSHAGVRQDDVQGAGRQGHQHPGDLDLGDQDQRADRRGIHRAGRARPAHRL